MKILLHAAGVSMGGAQRHLTNLLAALARNGKEHTYVVLARDSVLPAGPFDGCEFVRLPDSGGGAGLSRLGTDLLRTPWRARRGRCDVIVSLTNHGPILTPVPHAVFQRNALLFSSEHWRSANLRERARLSIRRRLAIETMRRARLVITPSHAMADLVRQQCPMLASKPFRVLYHGSSPETMSAPLRPEVAQLLDRPGVRLLYPTHGALHKGFQHLLEICVLLRDRLDYTLYTTIGAESPEVFAYVRERVRSLGLERRFVFTGQVAQAEMGGLYARCDLMLYPSLLESFGYPMVEAMGWGLPIVAAGTPVNREICGKAARYFAAGDAAAGAAEVIAALAPEQSAILRQEGARQLQRLGCSWDEYPAKFLSLLEGMV